MLGLNNVINQRDTVDIYRLFHPNTEEYTLFSAADGAFSKTDILGHETSLNRYKKTEVTSSLLPDHHGLNLDINNRNNTVYKCMKTEQLTTE